MRWHLILPGFIEVAVSTVAVVLMRVGLIHALPTIVSQAKVFLGPLFHPLESGVTNLFTLGSAIALMFVGGDVVWLFVAIFVVDFHGRLRLPCRLVFVTLAFFLLGHLSLLVLLLHRVVQVAVVIVLSVESFRRKTLMITSFFVLLRLKLVRFFSLLRSYTLNEWFIVWFRLWVTVFFVFFRNLFEIITVVWVLGLSLGVSLLLFLTRSAMVLRFRLSVLLFLVHCNRLLLFATLVRVPGLLIRWLHLSLTILVFILSLLMLANFTILFSMLQLLLFLWHAGPASSSNLVFLAKGLIHISMLTIASVFGGSALREGKLSGFVIFTLLIIAVLIRLIRVTLYLLSASCRISDFHLSHFSLQYSLSLINFLSLSLFLLLLSDVVLFVESNRFTHINVKSILARAHLIVVGRFALFVKDVHGLPLLTHSRLHLLAAIIGGSFLQDCVIDFDVAFSVLHYAVDFSQVVEGELVL